MREVARDPPGVFPDVSARTGALILLRMKISSDPGMVSPLETWLRDTAEVVAPQTYAAGDSTLTVPNNTTPSRDSAEGLLELDIWNGAPDGSRLLSASATFQPRTAEPAGVIQSWADHIFQPLV